MRNHCYITAVPFQCFINMVPCQNHYTDMIRGIKLKISVGVQVGQRDPYLKMTANQTQDHRSFISTPNGRWWLYQLDWMRGDKIPPSCGDFLAMWCQNTHLPHPDTDIFTYSMGFDRLVLCLTQADKLDFNFHMTPWLVMHMSQEPICSSKSFMAVEIRLLLNHPLVQR